jgi:hypothetical protein
MNAGRPPATGARSTGQISAPSRARPSTHTAPHGASAVGDLISLSEDWPLAGGRARAPTPAYRVCGCAHAAGLPAPGRVDCWSIAWPGQEAVAWRDLAFTHGQTLVRAACSCSLQQGAAAAAGSWRAGEGRGRLAPQCTAFGVAFVDPDLSSLVWPFGCGVPHTHDTAAQVSLGQVLLARRPGQQEESTHSLRRITDHGQQQIRIFHHAS